MKKRFYLLAVLAFIGAFYSIVPASAQDTSTEAERALIDFVARAFEHTRQVDSMAAEIQQTTQQSISMLGVFNIKTLEQHITGKIAFNDADTHVDMTIRQSQSLERVNGDSTTSDTQTFSQTVDIIVIGSRLYTRVRDVVSEMATPVSDAWLEIATNETIFAGVGFYSAGQFLSLMSDGFQYPLTTSVIRSINETDADEIDGQSMRVFDIRFDWERLRHQTQDEFALLKYLMWDLTSESERELEMRVWIGADDELVHRVDVTAKTEIELDRDADNAYDTVYITETDTISYHYAQFNEPFEIEAPL